jgi:hypothetical protein
VMKTLSFPPISPPRTERGQRSRWATTAASAAYS